MRYSKKVYALGGVVGDPFKITSKQSSTKVVKTNIIPKQKNTPGQTIKQRDDFEDNFITRMVVGNRPNRRDYGELGDLYNYYSGQPLQHKALEISKNKPTNAKDINAEYISINNDNFKKQVVWNYNRVSKYGVRKNPKNNKFEEESKTGKDTYNVSSYTDAFDERVNEDKTLGHYTVSKGKDEKGDYISYYDRFDTTVGKGEAIHEKLGFGKPFEIYDRIYVDKYNNPIKIKDKDKDTSVLSKIKEQSMKSNQPMPRYAKGGRLPMKYEEGGFLKNNSGVIGAGAEALAGFIPQDTGAGRVGGGILKGASAGAALGPWGIAGGALVGGAMSLFNEKAIKRQEAKDAENKLNYNNQMTSNISNQNLAGYEQYGLGTDYYAKGGNIIDLDPSQYEVEKGEVIQGQPQLEEGQKLSSDMHLVGGDKHEQGGTDGVGGERVFSDRLKLDKTMNKAFKTYGVKDKATYADAAKAIGKDKAKAEKKLSSKMSPSIRTGQRMLEDNDSALDMLFTMQELSKPQPVQEEMIQQPQFALGGNIDPTKQKIDKTVYTDNPNDPRIKKYNDSLNLYKAYKMQDKLMGKESKPVKDKYEWSSKELQKGRKLQPIPRGDGTYIKNNDGTPLLASPDFANEKSQFKNGFNSFSSRKEDKELIKYYKSLGFNDSNIMYHSSPDVVNDKIKPIGTYFDGTAHSPIYKKPTTPIKYNSVPKTGWTDIPYPKENTIQGNPLEKVSVVGTKPTPKSYGYGPHNQGNLNQKQMTQEEWDYAREKSGFKDTYKMSGRTDGLTSEAHWPIVDKYVKEFRNNKGKPKMAWGGKVPIITADYEKYNPINSNNPLGGLSSVRDLKAQNQLAIPSVLPVNNGVGTLEQSFNKMTTPNITSNLDKVIPDVLGDTKEGGSWIKRNEGQLINGASYLSNLNSINKLDTNVNREYVNTPNYNYTNRSGLAKRDNLGSYRTAIKGLTSSSQGVNASNAGALYAKTLDANNQINNQENQRRDQYEDRYGQRVDRINYANASINNDANDLQRELQNNKRVGLPLQARNAFLQGYAGNTAMSQKANLEKQKMILSAYLNDENGVMGRLDANKMKALQNLPIFKMFN